MVNIAVECLIRWYIVSRKESVLTILAVTFGIGLTAGGAWAIFMAVWLYTKLGFEAQARFFAFMFVVLAVFFLFGGVLLLLRAFRGPKKSRGNSWIAPTKGLVSEYWRYAQIRADTWVCPYVKGLEFLEASKETDSEGVKSCALWASR